MARQGICINYGHCSYADEKRPMSLDRTGGICRNPDCEQKLQPLPPCCEWLKKAGLLMLLALILVGCGWYFSQNNGQKSDHVIPVKYDSQQSCNETISKNMAEIQAQIDAIQTQIASTPVLSLTTQLKNVQKKIKDIQTQINQCPESSNTQIVEPHQRIEEIYSQLVDNIQKQLETIEEKMSTESLIPQLETLRKQVEAIQEAISGTNKVVDFYIPVDKSKVQEEVWMTTDNLEDWLSLLKPFKNLAGLSVSKQRKVFVNLLRKQVQEIIGTYPRYEITLGEAMAEAKKKVLPMRQNGPLLQYSIKEIREEIEACEVTRLINWVTAIRKVLQKVYNSPTQKPVFSLEYPSRWTHCPLSDKGKKVPELKFGRVVAQALGPDDNYRYNHSLYGQIVYWLPIDFLP